MSDTHALPINLIYQENGGFMFTLKKSDLDEELPRGFINVTAQKGRWLFSSLDLVKILLCERHDPLTDE